VHPVVCFFALRTSACTSMSIPPAKSGNKEGWTFNNRPAHALVKEGLAIEREREKTRERKDEREKSRERKVKTRKVKTRKSQNEISTFDGVRLYLSV
jgi:hypothetical protein